MINAINSAGHGEAGRGECILSCRAIEREGLPPYQYFAAGQGLQTLVIVNAYGQSIAFWDLLIRQLAGRYRILIVQPRGTLADTGAMQAALPVQEHVRDMQAVFDAEAVGAAHVIAWHTGLKTALGLYAGNPHRVASMCFLSASAVADMVGIEPMRSRYEAALTRLCRILGRQPELAGHVVELLKDLLTAEPYGRADMQSEPDGDESERIALIKALALEPFRTQASVSSFAQQMLAYWENDVSNILPQILVPTLFIGGDADHVITMKAVKATAARVPLALWAKIMGGTHFMQCDRYPLIAGVLAEFIEKGRVFDYRDPSLKFGHATPQPFQRTPNHMPSAVAEMQPNFAAHS